ATRVERNRGTVGTKMECFLVLNKCFGGLLLFHQLVSSQECLIREFVGLPRTGLRFAGPIRGRQEGGDGKHARQNEDQFNHESSHSLKTENSGKPYARASHNRRDRSI